MRKFSVCSSWWSVYHSGCYIHVCEWEKRYEETHTFPEKLEWNMLLFPTKFHYFEKREYASKDSYWKKEKNLRTQNELVFSNGSFNFTCLNVKELHTNTHTPFDIPIYFGSHSHPNKFVTSWMCFPLDQGPLIAGYRFLLQCESSYKTAKQHNKHSKL